MQTLSLESHSVFLKHSQTSSNEYTFNNLLYNNAILDEFLIWGNCIISGCGHKGYTDYCMTPFKILITEIVIAYDLTYIFLLYFLSSYEVPRSVPENKYTR